MFFALLINHHSASIDVLFMDIQAGASWMDNLHTASLLRRRETHSLKYSTARAHHSIWRRQFVVLCRFPDQTQLRAQWHHSLRDLVTGATRTLSQRAPIFIVRCDPHGHGRLSLKIAGFPSCSGGLYERRQWSSLDIAGGHRPPLQMKLS